MTTLGTWNFTKVYTNDSSGATLDQTKAFGKNFALTDNPSLPTYYKYNVVTKHTYFNYAKLTGDVTPSTRLEDTVYSYYYKNDTESALDATLTPADIAAGKGLGVTLVPNGKLIANGHVPGYTKLNVYKIYGNILHIDQDVPFGTIKTGLWSEKADTGPRYRADYDATASLGAPSKVTDFRQKVVAGYPNTPQYLEYLQYSGWTQYEPFIDVVWKVSPKLTITPGLKYMNEKIHVDADVNQSSRLPFHGSKTFSKTLYFLTGNYKIRDNWSAYAQYATGFLVPDISATQKVNPNLNDLVPQQSTNYQIGTVYHGNKITFDGDIYDVEFQNKLQSTTVGSETVFFNLGGARYKGIEGALTVAVADHWFAFGNASLNSAKALGASAILGGVPFVVAGGKQIANAPRSTASLGGIYRDGNWSVSLVDKYTGDQWAAEGEPDAYKINAYNSTDFTVVYSFDRYRIEAAVYNLLDSQKSVSIKPGKTVPYDQYYWQPERNFQVSIKANF